MLNEGDLVADQYGVVRVGLIVNKRFSDYWEEYVYGVLWGFKLDEFYRESALLKLF